MIQRRRSKVHSVIPKPTCLSPLAGLRTKDPPGHIYRKCGKWVVVQSVRVSPSGDAPFVSCRVHPDSSNKCACDSVIEWFCVHTEIISDVWVYWVFIEDCGN